MNWRLVSLWGPVIVVASGIAFLSHISSPPSPESVPDWFLHGLEYSVLGFLLARALFGGLLNGRPAPRVMLTVLILGSLYGISDEVHQAFVPGRDAAVGDVLADVVGTSIGLTLAAIAAVLLSPRVHILQNKFGGSVVKTEMPTPIGRKV